MERSVSIRMGTSGKADVTRTFDEMGASGEASAKRWSKAYERAGEDVEAALQRQANAAAKIAAIAPQSPVQMRIADTNGTGFGQWEGSARSSAAAFRDLMAAEEQLEARTRALVASIDPAFNAQQRFNSEMAEARDLVSRGAISLDQYVAKLRLERDALNQSTAAQIRGAVSAGAHRAAMQGLSFQAQDAMTQLSMGANVFNVVAIQGAQAAGQMANLEGKLGSAAKFMIGPWGLAITGGMMLLGALTDHLLENEGASERAEAGMKKFQDRQSDIGNFIDTTTGKLKEQNRTLILNAILTRQAQIATNEKAITEARNKAFDRAADASLRVARAPGMPTGGANFTGGVSFEDDADVQRIIRGAKGDVAKLANDMAALAKTRPGLAKVALDISGIGGQAILATRENAELKKELQALNGDTTALRKAEAAASAGRTAAGSSARNAGSDYRGAAASVRDEAQAQRELLSSLQSLEGRYDPLAASARRFRDELTDIAKLQAAGLIDPTKAETYRQAAFASTVPAAGKSTVLDDWAAEQQRREAAVKSVLGDVGFDTELAKREREMVGLSDRQRGNEIEKLRVIMGLKRENASLSEQEVATILQAIGAYQREVDALDAAKAGMRELRDFGTDFAETVLSEDTWSSWGNAGKTMLSMLKSEFIKLALLNPLKNLINGDKALPTASSVISNIGKLFGPKGVGNNAAGTEWWSGGATWLAENGPEIVNLPAGSKVTPAGETRRLLGGAGGMFGGEMKLKLELTPSDYFDARVASVSGPLVAQGAAAGAAGGAQMAEADSMAAGARRLGRWR